MKLKIKSRSGLSKRFIFSLSLAYAFLIITSALIVNSALNMTLSSAEDIIFKDNARYYSKLLDVIADNAEERKISHVSELKAYLKRKCGNDEAFMHVILYERTGDENFFRVIDHITLDKSFRTEIKTGQTISPEKGLAQMKKALTGSEYDPAYYKYDGMKWQNIYRSYRTDKRTILIQAQVSASTAERSKSLLLSGSRLYRIIVFIISLIIVGGVIATTWLFYQSYSDILKGLASHFDRAAQGNFNVHIKQSEDRELNRVADSFNSLIDCIKDQHTMTMETDEYVKYINSQADSIFAEGVSLMKDGQTDEAVVKFRTVCTIRPESHSSFFNLGVAYARSKKYAEALDIFDRAIEINPAHDMSRKYREKVARLSQDHE